MWSYLSLQVFTLRSWIHGTNNSSYNLHCINIKERLIILKSPEWWLFCRAFQQLNIKKLFFNLYRHQRNNLSRKDLQLFASVIKKTSWYNITLLKLTFLGKSLQSKTNCNYKMKQNTDRVDTVSNSNINIRNQKYLRLDSLLSKVTCGWREYTLQPLIFPGWSQC